MVRNMRAVLKKASWGTRRIFVRLSVPKTGFYGTEEIFGAQNRLLWYAMHLQRCAKQPPATGRIFSARNGPRSEVIRLKRG